MNQLTEQEMNDRIGWVQMDLLFSSKPIDLVKESFLEEFPGEDELFDEIIQILVD